MHNKASHPDFANSPRRMLSKGFTLIEILIVVVILGILATIVVPQFSNASHEAKENSLKDDLRYLRTQIAVYKAQHRDVAPGSGSGSFTLQMTLPTDESGATNATSSSVYKFGPYLTRIPYNPLNNLDTIKLSSSATLSADIDDTTGWIYNPSTQQIISNLSGSDGHATPYAQY
ncbi:MAG TPA: type II secretion system protein [Tepidisphaeraceae bacterium]|nr:type II secretion system protein [Tepidisphaeraceae bacterium]